MSEDTFYKTITESPQWKAWQEEQHRRFLGQQEEVLPKRVKVYDMSEVMECGWISPEHFQEFIKFVKENNL